jgi:acetyltransferase
MTRCSRKYGFIVSNDLDEGRHHCGGSDHQSDAEGRSRRRAHGLGAAPAIWGADTEAMQGLQVPELSETIQAEIGKLLPSYGATRNPIDVTAQGVHSGGLQKSIDLLDVSDEVDAILVVLSLSSDTGCRSSRPS